MKNKISNPAQKINKSREIQLGYIKRNTKWFFTRLSGILMVSGNL